MKTKLRKTKYLEVVMFTGEVSYLKHHLENVYDFVDKIILLSQENLEFHTSMWSDKIIPKNFETPISYKDEIVNDYLKSLIPKLQLNFDDVLVFSLDSEIPDFENFDEIDSHLKFEPVIIRNTNFVFNFKNQTKIKHLGSVCTTLSMFITKPKILVELTNLKEKIISESFYIVDNGFNHEFFFEKNKLYKKFQIEREKIDFCLTNNLHPNSIINNVPNQIIDFVDESKLKKNYIEEVSFQQDNPKKICLVINIFQNKLDSVLLKNYNRILNFNFTDDYSLQELTVVDNIENINIFLPPSKLYEIEFGEVFNLSFFLNEFKKKTTELGVRDLQQVELILFYDDFEKSESIISSWGDLKKNHLKIFTRELVEYFN